MCLPELHCQANEACYPNVKDGCMFADVLPEVE